MQLAFHKIIILLFLYGCNTISNNQRFSYSELNSDVQYAEEGRYRRLQSESEAAKHFDSGFAIIATYLFLILLEFQSDFAPVIFAT